jgi:hypothetical protein
MITTQQIPETLAPWSKNRRKIVPAMESAGKTGNIWGIAFRGSAVTSDL